MHHFSDEVGRGVPTAPGLHRSRTNQVGSSTRRGAVGTPRPTFVRTTLDNGHFRPKMPLNLRDKKNFKKTLAEILA
jgi:hypothetical protein